MLGIDYTSGTGCWVATYDQALQPGAVDAGNWTFNVGGVGRVGLGPVTVAGATVSGATSIGPLVDPVDSGSYRPPPHDIISVVGVPACKELGVPLNYV